MNPINKVNKICKDVRKLTPDDFEALGRMTEEQIGYIHPLKHAKQNKINSVGDYNLKVMGALLKLKEIIDSYEK